MDDSDARDSTEEQLRAYLSVSYPASPTRVVSAPEPNASYSLPTSPVKRLSMGARPSSHSNPDPGQAGLSALQQPSVITNDVFVMDSDHGSHQGVFEGAPFWEDNVSNSEINLPRPVYAPPKHKGLFSGIKGFAIVVLMLLIVFVVGVILGMALRPRCPKKEVKAVTVLEPVQDYSPKLSQSMQREVKPEIMETEMKWFASKVHQAGSRENFKVADRLYSAWSHLNFDELFFDNYTVQVSLADKDRPNTVKIYESEKLVFTANSSSESVGGDLPYNAYSPAGTVVGEYVFVNYGSSHDFALLRDLNISLDGRIAVARLGGGYRAGVAARAAKASAVGLIIYADPADFAFNKSQIYPRGWLLPGDAPIFGNMRIKGGGGDPLTPDLPAVDGIIRTKNSTIKFSKIPVQSVGYDDAKTILDKLQGTKVPDKWSRSLGKHIGPTPNITLEIVSRNRLVEKPIQNVVAVIRGHLEPDRLVVLGNHYDAWLYGASDPLSGTVIVQQVSKLFSDELGRAYRPRRTLVFAAWDAEEMGTIGSTEFTERLSAKLGAQAVAYINLDCPVKGDYSFFVRSSPLLRGVTLQAAQSVFLSDKTNVTVLDDWTAKLPDKKVKGKPEMPLLGGGSDQGGFLFKLGIPSVYPQYIYNGMLPNMPAYHTKYDTFEMMNNITDPGFVHHGLVARVVIDMLLRLGDSPILPLSVNEYPPLMRQFTERLKTDKSKYLPLNDGTINLDILLTAINELENATTKFLNGLKPLKNATSPNTYVLRTVNDILMQVPRAFLWPEGLPSRPYYKNILLSPSLSNSYGGSFLSGFLDGLVLGKENGDWEPACRHFSILLNAIRGATLLLRDRFI